MKDFKLSVLKHGNWPSVVGRTCVCPQTNHADFSLHTVCIFAKYPDSSHTFGTSYNFSVLVICVCDTRVCMSSVTSRLLNNA